MRHTFSPQVCKRGLYQFQAQLHYLRSYFILKPQPVISFALMEQQFMHFY